VLCRPTRKNVQVVTNLQQTCSNAVPTTCQQHVFALLVPSLLTSCQRLVDNLPQGCWAQQTCYKLFQQLVIVLQFNNLSTKQLVDKLSRSLLRTHLVDKLWDICVCTKLASACISLGKSIVSLFRQSRSFRGHWEFSCELIMPDFPHWHLSYKIIQGV
jgi:hypothetical protein